MARLSLQKFSRFLVVGAIATGTQYVLLIILVEAFGIDAVVSSATGFALSSLLNYWLNYSFTFDTDVPHREAMPKFFVTVALGLTINTVSMYVLVNLLGLFYIIAQIVATAVTLLWNFSVHSLWSFRKAGE